jgi:hypothetical protein
MPGPEQSKHGHDAALAVIVRAQDQDGVLERDDEEQRPKDEGDGSDHRVVLEGATCGCDLDGLLERVERTGADIAVDDAERAEGQGDGGGSCRELRFACLDRDGHQFISIHSQPSATGAMLGSSLGLRRLASRNRSA